ncbi:hypothetical protein MRX96_040175 [Rhipicephalus microplus]
MNCGNLSVVISRAATALLDSPTGNVLRDTATTTDTGLFSLFATITAKNVVQVDSMTEQHRRALSDSMLTRHNLCCPENGSLPSVSKMLPQIDPVMTSKRRGTTQ